MATKNTDSHSRPDPRPITNREALKLGLIGLIWTVCTVYAVSLWVLL